MKKLILTLLFVSSVSIYSQLVPNGCLTDVYMGNYGYYDYQSAGANQSITGGINQNYHSVYLSADSVLNSPQRRALYFFSSDNGSTWQNTPVSNLNASYPSVGVQIDGKAVICFYDSASSKIKFYRTTSPTAMTFDTLPSPPGNGGEYAKFQIMGSRYIVLFAVFQTASQPHISRSVYDYNSGSWSAWQITALNASTSFQSAKSFAKVSLCWIGDSTYKRVKYIESVDSGLTFGSANTIFSEEFTGGDTVRAFKNIDMAYYNNNPVITFDAVARILPLGGQPGIRKFYHNPKVFFWSQTTNIVKVADTSNYIYGDVAGRNTMVSMGKDCLPVGSPTICASNITGNKVHIFYSAMRLSIPKGNSWYDSDIVGLLSFDNGSNYSTIPGIIPEPNYDDKFTFLAKQMPPSGFPYTISLVHQKDLFPGSYRQGDTTAITRAYPEFNGYNLVFHIIHPEVLKYDFYLFNSYPNPFNASAKIEFGLQKPGFVKLIVYDVLGREVTVLVDKRLQQANYVTFFHGNDVPSGIYFYTMFVDGVLVETKRMVLVK